MITWGFTAGKKLSDTLFAAEQGLEYNDSEESDLSWSSKHLMPFPT